MKTIPAKPDQADPRVYIQLLQAHKTCLTAAALLASLSLCADIFPALSTLLSIPRMSAEAALSTLAAAASLALSLPGIPAKFEQASRLLAILTVLPALAALWQQHTQTAQVDPVAPLAFLLLAALLFCFRCRTAPGRYLADGSAFLLAIVVLTAVSSPLLSTTHLFAFQPHPLSGTTLSLMFLAFVAFGRRAEYGIGNILIGQGIGSHIARVVAPFLLVLPFAREIVRVLLLRSHLLPEAYAIAAMNSLAAMIALALLLYVSRRIARMEAAIVDMGIRDELTGLYNLRGFQLLAERALQFARRSGVPFSVIYLDLDNLKQVNDCLGHSAGSAFLQKAAEILKKVCRDTDVVGRIGGDEFAIAGHLSRVAVNIAIARLEKAAAQTVRMAQPSGKEFALSFSVGHVTSEDYEELELKELLDKADASMYEQKRRKKMLADEISV